MEYWVYEPDATGEEWHIAIFYTEDEACEYVNQLAPLTNKSYRIEPVED